MTTYEIEVLKKYLNEALCQLDAEVTDYGTTTTTPKTDRTETFPPETETTCTTSKVYLSEEGYTTFKVSTYERNRGYIGHLILTGMIHAGNMAICNIDDRTAQRDCYKEIVNMIMETLDTILKG